MPKKTLLVEIGTEELPPKGLSNLAKSFAMNFAIELNEAGFIYDHIKWFATPRRLAFKVINLVVLQYNRLIEKRGPAINQAFDIDGKPSKIAKNWASSCGININQAERLTTNKGEWLVYRYNIKGKNIEFFLPKMIVNSLSKITNLKLMRWNTSNVQFVRPIHTITLLLNDKIIPATILGIKSKPIVLGHRFIGEKKIIISNADHYQQILTERGKVIADYEERKTKIRIDAEKAASEIGGHVDLNENILDEVTSLVEWPVVLTAKFETKFLTIPVEVIICILKKSQKYFPVYATNGNLLPNFIFVANIESSDPQKIIYGNEKVVRSRLADAEFFFKIDCKKRLEENFTRLKSVIFQQQLGTLHDKTNRIIKLASWIAKLIGANINYTIRASFLSKCDLMTNMVFEFADIQGIMGMHYARHDGEEEDVAIALKEQYQPRFSGDQLPSNLVSCALAIADKMDTITGIFGIGQKPKGSKDPFALRRATLGVLRIIIEKKLNIDLKNLTEEAVHLYGDILTNAHVTDDVVNFMLKRFCSLYLDKGYSIYVIRSVLARHLTCPQDLDIRIKAISRFIILKESSTLIESYKRISNFLAKSTELKAYNAFNTSLLKEVAEINLATSLIILHNKLQLFFAKNQYYEALVELISICELINDFFKKVTINIEDKKLRFNRIALLFKLRELFLQIADISLLE